MDSQSDDPAGSSSKLARDMVNEFLHRTEVHRDQGRRQHGPYPPVICRDGYTVSIQAGEHAYSTPRSHLGPWTEVELGFPSRQDLDLMPWAESEDDLLHTVYAYVPVEKVCEVLQRHGGIDYDALALCLLYKK